MCEESCQLIVKGRRNFTTDLQNTYLLCKKVQIFDKVWKPAVITDQHSNRSYILQTHDGNVYRRNRKFIHKSKDQTREDSDLMPLLKSQEKNCELSGMPISQAHSDKSSTQRNNRASAINYLVRDKPPFET